jgi:hypothetical protein
VISYQMWQRRYHGASDAIGRDVQIDRTRFTIVGVAPAAFSGLNVGDPIDLILPIETRVTGWNDREPVCDALHRLSALPGAGPRPIHDGHGGSHVGGVCSDRRLAARSSRRTHQSDDSSPGNLIRSRQGRYNIGLTRLAASVEVITGKTSKSTMSLQAATQVSISWRLSVSMIWKQRCRFTSTQLEM